MKKLAYQQQVSSRCSRRLFAAGLFFVGLMACLAIGVSTAQAQINTKMYNIKSMGILAGMKACEPAAMNNLGQVTGTATAGEHQAAFLYYYSDKEEEMEAVGDLGSRAFAINPAGIIVGDAYFPSQLRAVSHAALFNGGGVADLGTLKDQMFSRATGMNAMRQVVGYSGNQRDSAESRAFIWTSMTGMIDIGTLGGPFAQALAINDPGFVTGTSQTNEWVRSGATHAFTYQPLSITERNTKKMRDLGTLGGDSSYGMAINASNHVVGYSTISTADGRVHAFFHGGHKMIDLGTLGRDALNECSAALAVNNADQVVGVNYTPTNDRDPFNQVAFIWSPRAEGGEMINLNHLIAQDGQKKYWILTAAAINDSGQIAASAYDYENKTTIAVLLTPAE